MSNIFIELKKTCLGVLDRGKRGDGNETGLKEGGGMKMSTTVLSIYAMIALLRLLYLLTKLLRHRALAFDVA